MITKSKKPPKFIKRGPTARITRPHPVVPKVDVLAVEPLAVTGEVAGRMLGRSGRWWRERDLTGAVPRSVRIAGSDLWIVSELRRWASAGCPPRRIFEEMLNGRAEEPLVG